MEFMKICNNRIPLAGMDIDNINTGEKYEQFGEVLWIVSLQLKKILNFSF